MRCCKVMVNGWVTQLPRFCTSLILMFKVHKMYVVDPSTVNELRCTCMHDCFLNKSCKLDWFMFSINHMELMHLYLQFLYTTIGSTSYKHLLLPLFAGAINLMWLSAQNEMKCSMHLKYRYQPRIQCTRKVHSYFNCNASKLLVCYLNHTHNKNYVMLSGFAWYWLSNTLEEWLWTSYFNIVISDVIFWLHITLNMRILLFVFNSSRARFSESDWIKSVTWRRSITLQTLSYRKQIWLETQNCVQRPWCFEISWLIGIFRFYKKQKQPFYNR